MTNEREDFFKDPKDLLPVIEYVKEHWKKNTNVILRYAESSVHDCIIDYNNCEMYYIPFDVYVDRMEQKTCNVLIDEFKVIGMNIDQRTWMYVNRMTSLYVCTLSGRFHACGIYCDSMVPMGKDQLYTCKYTSVSLGDVPTRSMYDYMPLKTNEEKKMFKESYNPLYQANMTKVRSMHLHIFWSNVA